MKLNQCVFGIQTLEGDDFSYKLKARKLFLSKNLNHNSIVTAARTFENLTS